MSYLEFPKIVYLGGDVEAEPRRVRNADEQAAAEAVGFRALPANPPPEAAQPGGPLHLEFPKILYVGGLIDGDTRRVKNAEEESAAAADGFLPLGAPAALPPQSMADELAAMSAKDAIAKVQTLGSGPNDADLVRELAESETRATVKKAFEKRISDLLAQ